MRTNVAGVALLAILLFFVACPIVYFTGCNSDKSNVTPPRPRIEVETNETSMADGAEVLLKVSFIDHIQAFKQGDHVQYRAEVKFENIEQLNDYEKQVQFLLQKIKEAKEKMMVPGKEEKK